MKLPKEPASSEITAESLYMRRREFIKNAALFAGTTTAVGAGLLYLASGGKADSPESPASEPPKAVAAPPDAGAELAPLRGRFDTDEPMTPFKDVTTYNNFYEFGVDKSDPSENAHTLRPRPWTVSLAGQVRGFHHAPRQCSDARPAAGNSRLALRRRTPDRRGDEPPGAPRGGTL